jgi:hypothetical protein
MMSNKKILKLKPSNLHTGEHSILWWQAEPEEGTPYEALFNPIYWDACNALFGRGHFIQVIPAEGHYIAWLRVRDADAGVHVQEIFKKELSVEETQPSSLSDHFRVKFAGSQHKWRVERIVDNHIEMKGLADEGAALAWLAENGKRLIGFALTKAA